MLLSTVLGATAALVGLASAQTQSQPADTAQQTPSAEEIKLLEQARAAYPICAVSTTPYQVTSTK